ncbi:dephospho-CoA kinase [Mycoplasmopsis californica HAZ160_1]|nr:dephospho-CoA kinase [Mycoplasmopsis californica HAZ160_1]BBG41158.1 dephospho-CoA kinase [Mycoplasmopsis californica]BBG41751.1 dephospho-CoA kinase [Mycoplasmopsis californica]BBG42345.1 dephospho-CoA kinase [Mycoplasmopsis californica]BBG42920.1 dephospho-CoA kinase [Mycoplasmopsis californica]
MRTEMIALIGKVGVGKSTFLRNSGLKKEKIFICDEFVAKEYKKYGILYNEIKQKIGTFLLDEKGVSKKKILKWLFENTDNIDKLERVVFPKIFDAIKNGNFAIVEIPVLVNKNFNFLSLFSAVLCLSTSEQKRWKNIQKRSVDKLTIKAIDQKNSTILAKNQLFGQIPVVDIYLENFESYDRNKKILDLVKLIN